jgi:hypothetical protein
MAIAKAPSTQIRPNPATRRNNTDLGPVIEWFGSGAIWLATANMVKPITKIKSTRRERLDRSDMFRYIKLTRCNSDWTARRSRDRSETRNQSRLPSFYFGRRIHEFESTQNTWACVNLDRYETVAQWIPKRIPRPKAAANISTGDSVSEKCLPLSIARTV